jgi:hypothetical protein
MPIDMYVEILYNLDIFDLLEMCKVNQYVSNLCKSDRFWQGYIIHNEDPGEEVGKWDAAGFNKYLKDIVGRHNDILTWKELAKYIFGFTDWVTLDLRIEGIYYPTSIPISFNDTVNSFITKLIKKMQTLVPEYDTYFFKQPSPIVALSTRLPDRPRSDDAVIFISELGIIVAKAPLSSFHGEAYDEENFYKYYFEENNFLTTIDMNMPIGKWIINGVNIFFNLNVVRVDLKPDKLTQIEEFVSA